MMKFLKVKKFFPKTSLIFATVLFLLSCNQKPETAETTANHPDSTAAQKTNRSFLTDCKSLLAAAKTNDSILLNETEVNKISANKAIKAFTDYASYCHNDTLSPVYLIKCAQVARAVDNIPQAKIVLEECLQKYP